MLEKIKNKILALSPFVKDAKICVNANGLHALLYPDFEAFKKAGVINIESELRWYAVELYNLGAQENEKIKSYKIVSDMEREDDAIVESETYVVLKKFLSDLSSKEVFFSSHIELDLELDSLDYVELFIFIEESFGVFVNEETFARLMIVKDLYEFVEKNKLFTTIAQLTLKEVLKEPARDKPKRSPYVMLLYKTVLYPIFKLYFRMEVKGLQNIPQSVCVIAPSHQSMLDGFLIEASLPFEILKKTFFLAYKNVFGTKLLTPIANNGQTILIDANRNLLHTMKLVASPLQSGDNVVIFPEGARSRDRELLEFRPFFAMLAKIYNVPVVPVAIDGSFEALRSGTSFPLPKKIKITYLEAVFPDDLSVDEIVWLTKKRIQEQMQTDPI